ncbi:MAG: septum formation protein Maf [Lentisphaeria bacterium]|nr:septum formation protein Maf [Lentisphaeria bacterium]
MLYLASESPRRRELLKKLGFPFIAETAHVTELEQADETCSVSLLPEANSKLKAQAVSRRHPEDTVIGADTSIILDDKILGKPRDLPDARRVLTLLSGRSHEVITGVTVMRAGTRPFLHSWSDTSTVTFKKLSPEIIEEYLSKVNVLDKAGAYAIQEHGDMIISGFTGDLDNIIGLPTVSLAAFFSSSSPFFKTLFPL